MTLLEASRMVCTVYTVVDASLTEEQSVPDLTLITPDNTTTIVDYGA